MSGYNEAKVVILEALIDVGEATVDDLVGLLGWSREGMAMALLRYSRQGLVSRRREGREYIYSLTQRGFERLEYLTSEEENIESDE